MEITGASFLHNFCDALFFGRMNVDILQREMAELRDMREETARAVECTKRTAQVNRWLELVDDVEAAVGGLVNDLNNPSISGLSRLRLLWQCRDTLKVIRQLKSQGAALTVPGGTKDAFSAVKSHLRGDGVGIVGVHCLGGHGNNGSTGDSAATGESSSNLDAGIKAEGGSRSLLGREGTLSEIRRHLKDDDSIGIICVHGAPGSGKTAILRQIYDEFHTGGLFDLAIYVTLSRDGDIRSLRQDLCATMGLSNSSYGEEELGKALIARLSKKRYLLLLDDVRGKLDLTSMGVPPPSAYNRSKIIFTTRTLESCTYMGAQAIVKLDPLNEDQAWKLFRRVLGPDAVLRDPCIRDLAQQMVDGCRRPLALVTMGQAMADQRLLIEWQHAAEALKVSEITYQQNEGTNLDTQLFSRLKVSYDYLGDDKLRSCLLYCALFPEGQDIDREQLIEYWIGEGLLDFGDHASLYVARNRGHMIIRSLQSAGLLQTGIRDGERFVKLDEAVRDMALWITSGKSGMEEGSRLLVEAGKGLATVPRVEQWSSATRVSLMQNHIEKLPDKLPRSCSKLLTLLINDCNPQQVQGPKLEGCRISESTESISAFLPETFFGFFPTLRVLDLSRSPVCCLPSTVSSLCELHYLNLSYTSISSLPTELGKLVKMRQLDLSYTEQLSEVPPQAISGLKALQLLNLYGSRYSEVKLEDLGRLQTLTELGISLTDVRLLAGLQLYNEKLRRSLRYLKLFQMNGLIVAYLDHAFSVLSRLRELRLDECNQLEEFTVVGDQLLFLQVLQLEHLAGLSTVKLGLGDPKTRGAHVSPALRRLSHLRISHCSKLKQLEWFGHLPRLTEVHVHYCNAMEQLLIGGGSGGEEDQNNQDSLPRLRKLSLRSLSSLGVSGIPLLKSLGPEAMDIEGCSMLKPLLQ